MNLAEKVAHVGSAVVHEQSLSGIVDVLLDETIDTLGACFAYVHLADEKQQRLVLAGSRGVPESFRAAFANVGFDAPLSAARAATTRQAQLMCSPRDLDAEPRITRDVMVSMGCETLIALPLLARRRLVGVLTFALVQPQQLTSEERATLESCAELFAFGIAHAIAYEEERRLRALFEAVGNASVAIAGEIGLKSVLQSIVNEAREIVGAEHSALGIVAAEDRPFVPWVFSGMTPEQQTLIANTPRPLDALRAVTQDARTIRVADIRRDRRLLGVPDGYPPIVSLLVVPVRHDGRTIGHLYLANKRGAAEFSHEDEAAAELLASHAGVAVFHSQVHERLEVEKARFGAILENAPQAVHFVEAGTECLVANRRAYQIVGQQDIATLDDYRGQVCNPDGRPLPRADWPARRVLRGEIVQTHELLLRTPDGREVPVLLSAAPVFRPDGELEGAVVVYEDITTVKELQQLREEWTSIVAHDLRQPLNIITLFVNVLQEMGPSPDPAMLGRGLEQMLKAAGALNRMIGDLNDVSLIEARSLGIEARTVDLGALASEAVERQRALSPDRTIELHIDDRALTVEADSVRIGQVLDNLVVNAVKYSTPGTAIEVAVHGSDEEVQVRVTNHGEGIAAEDLPKVFDRYYRTARARHSKTRGLGLGLYIVKGLVEAHGGRIWVESTPGTTTTFQFVLPSRLS